MAKGTKKIVAELTDEQRQAKIDASLRESEEVKRKQDENPDYIAPPDRVKKGKKPKRVLDPDETLRKNIKDLKRNERFIEDESKKHMEKCIIQRLFLIFPDKEAEGVQDILKKNAIFARGSAAGKELRVTGYHMYTSKARSMMNDDMAAKGRDSPYYRMENTEKTKAIARQWQGERHEVRASFNALAENRKIDIINNYDARIVQEVKKSLQGRQTNLYFKNVYLDDNWDADLHKATKEALKSLRDARKDGKPNGAVKVKTVIKDESSDSEEEIKPTKSKVKSHQ